MRDALRAVALVVLLAAVGCHRDKYQMRPVVREEAVLPPNEKRYNEPDTAGFKNSRTGQTTKDDKALMNRPGGVGPLGPGGF